MRTSPEALLFFASAIFATGLVDAANPSSARRVTPCAEIGGSYDQSVAEAVAAKLRRTRLRSADIEIIVQDGRVRLTGRVATAADARRAGELAAAVDGVEKVENRLVVTRGARVAPVEAPRPPRSADEVRR